MSTVTDDKLNASSTYSEDYPAANARLNSTGWSPDQTEDDPWIQVQFKTGCIKDILCNLYILILFQYQLILKTANIPDIPDVHFY